MLVTILGFLLLLPVALLSFLPFALGAALKWRTQENSIVDGN